MKKTLVASVLALTLGVSSLAGAAGVVAVPGAGVTTKREVEQQQAFQTKQEVLKSLNSVVNWDKGADADIVVAGFGRVGADGAVITARRAAIVDGYRNLAETIGGVQVDSDTLVKDMMVANDVIRTNVSAVVKGAVIVEEGQLTDGNYYVKMCIPMFGEKNSVAAAILPEAMKDVAYETPEKITKKTTVLDKQEFKEAKGVKYTGIVIDCQGLGLDCTFAPQILDVNGRGIYGCENVDKDFAVAKGIVEYAKELNFAISGKSRAGANPLVIKASAVKGGTNSVNPVNAVISAEDGDKVLLAMQNNKELLTNCLVVFVR